MTNKNVHAGGAPETGIYVGKVMHGRLKPFGHRFIYRVFSLFLDIDRLDETARRLRLISYNRWNLFSFHDKDHGPRDGSPLRPHIDRLWQKTGCERPHRVFLLTFPRILGYVFNPLSVYFCYGRGGALTGLVYEVRNTFGGMHAYVMPVRPEDEKAAKIAHGQDKRFYVSPFIDMPMTYHFRLSPPGEKLHMRIHEVDAEGPVFSAIQNGVRRPLEDMTLLRLFFTHPLMTLKVIAGIHVEALQLVLKGAKYHGHRSVPDPGSATFRQ